MPSPRWRGSSALIESPDSPVITLNKDGLTYVKTFTGPHAACVAAIPARGVNVTGVPSSLSVDIAEVKKEAGGKGTLTITLVYVPDPGLGDMAGSENTSIHEIEWAEVQRPLAQHKRFQTGGENPLDDGDWTDIDGWKAEPDQSLRKDFKYKDKTGTEVTLGDGAQEFCKKLLRGQEIYNEYTPVARLTTSSTTKPTTGACGTIVSSPSVEGFPSGYKWLKTADRACKRSKKWERVQEWTGTWWWDTDIYAES